MTTRIVAICAGLNDENASTVLADTLAARIKEQIDDASIHLIALRPLAHEITDYIVTGVASEHLQHVFAGVAASDAIVAVTPVLKGAYPGLFKTFFDALDHEALIGKPALLAGTGDSAAHSTTFEMTLRPLFAYLQTVIVPSTVYAESSQVVDGIEPFLSGVIDRAVSQLAQLLRGEGHGQLTSDCFDDLSESWRWIVDAS